MLRSLKYSVTFPTTGRTLSADLTLGPGFWAITGPNESGKSMIFEVARWLLFGSDALRGKADDYKTLKATGVFIIKGNEIEIDRTARGATMRRNGEAIATGTKPVNLKVIEELGFGLAVFDIANSINQGEVERLGEMRPAERKAMLDSVLGLGALDAVSKWAAEEARAIDKQVEIIQEQLVHPGIAPVEPEGYEPVAVVRDRLAKAQDQADELALIEGWLAHEYTKPTPPEEKVALPSTNLKSLAEKHKDARVALAQLKAQVEGLPANVTYNDAQLDAMTQEWASWAAWREEADWAEENPRPSLTVDEANTMLAQWQLFDDWGSYAVQLQAADEIEQRIESAQKVHCPNCQHDFAMNGAQVDAWKTDLIEARLILLDMKPDQDQPEKPSHDRSKLQLILRLWDEFDEQRMLRFEGMGVPTKPALAPYQVDEQRTRNQQVKQRETLVKKLAVEELKFGQEPDYEAMLATREAYEAALSSYQSQLAEYETWLRDREDKRRRKAELAGAGERRDRAQADYQQAVMYESSRATYDAAAEAYEKGLIRVGELQEEAREHRKVREVMALLRGKIKQHVLPSLNLVASQLLWQMTDGQRARIYVDDDFNVTVDNQALDTLSGSGKAVANLSLRIALGQVLTNRVISIMLADEIDASMDALRAEKTSGVLRMLEERVSQVLLVSHKPVDAPHHVRLGGFSATDGN